KKWSREIILAAESLHSTGIVHGAIHERNVIVTGDDQVRLTHVSPLLYNDVTHDTADVVEMLQTLVDRDAPESKLASLLADARAGAWPLREVYARIVELDAEPPPPAPVARRGEERTFSAEAVVAAIAVAGIGVAVEAGV